MKESVKEEWITIEKDSKGGALFVLATPLVLFGILGGVGYLFLLGLLIYAILFIAHVYLLNIYKPLTAEAKWSHTRLFPGETLELKYRVANSSRFGLHLANWHFTLSKKLEIMDFEKNEGQIKHKYSSAFTIGANEGVLYSFTATGHKRGVAELEDVKLVVSDPFGLGVVTKELLLPKQEVIIYPELKSISGLEQLHRAPMGERSVSLFTHEDPTYILGARPYQYGDPFNRIDWKATAKNQEIHTKIIDRTAHTELVLVGNVRTYAERWRGINEEYLERTLSVLASLSHYAVKEDMPYQMMINMKPVGRKPLFRIKRGQGRKHLIYTLESLARMGAFSTIPFEEAVYLAYQDYAEGKIIVVSTAYVTDELQALLIRMSREGIPVYLIQTDQEELSIQKAGKGMKKYA
jgi:uncharacterized protein (DUF58 family)